MGKRQRKSENVQKKVNNWSSVRTLQNITHLVYFLLRTVSIFQTSLGGGCAKTFLVPSVFFSISGMSQTIDNF